MCNFSCNFKFFYTNFDKKKMKILIQKTNLSTLVKIVRTNSI